MFAFCEDPSVLDTFRWFACYLTNGVHLKFYFSFLKVLMLLAITAPGLFPDATSFADFYAKPIEKSGEAELLHLFRRRIKPLVKRRTKDLVAPELPAKQDQILDV